MPVNYVRATYFSDLVYVSSLEAIMKCEFDQVNSATLALQEFNRTVFPRLLKAFAGLSLASPIKALEVSHNVSGQMQSAIDSISGANEETNSLYHPIVLFSVARAILGVCSTIKSQFFLAVSSKKFASKICETPVARVASS